MDDKHFAPYCAHMCPMGAIGRVKCCKESIVIYNNMASEFPGPGSIRDCHETSCRHWVGELSPILQGRATTFTLLQPLSDGCSHILVLDLTANSGGATRASLCGAAFAVWALRPHISRNLTKDHGLGSGRGTLT